MKIDLLDTTSKPKHICKGLVFRGFHSMFVAGDMTIQRKEGIRLLKRKSCQGCPECEFNYWMMDNIREEVSMGSLIMPEIHHGELYTVRVINETRDWETGIVDSWETEVILMEKGE